MMRGFLILFSALFIHINQSGTSVVTMKEKYGGQIKYDSVAFVVDRDKSFYISSRNRVLAVLPKCNYAIIGVEK